MSQRPSGEEITVDVAIIGGGPAGATCGTLVAERGWKTLILERTRFPRFHIGESLMPETYWTFKRLGMLPKLRRSTFIEKYSVQFVNASGKESSPFYFDELNPHECSQTWQVLRSDFDRLMLENAAEHGAGVMHDANVVDVIVEDDRVVGLIAERPGGERLTVRARVVVDATGTSAMLSRKFGVRKPDPSLRKAAVFAHYAGGFRDPAPRDAGATLVLHVREQNGWFWSIPLPDDIVSIGVVGDVEYLTKGRKDPETVLAEEIEKCPFIVPRLAGARRVSPVHVIADYSYYSQRCAGDGWVLIGDAFTFLDPIYSSGVFLALTSGEWAADAIHAALRADDPSAKRLGCWGPLFYTGVQNIRKLVYAFYEKDFSFGQFSRAHPECRKNLVDLLIGDVFRSDSGAIFETMGRHVTLPAPLSLDA